MSEVGKVFVATAMWIAVGIIDFAVALGNQGSGDPLGWAFALPLFIALLITIYLWTVPALIERRKDNSAEQLEKRKRERIDAVLRDLSSEELHRLKQRLTDGTVDDDLLYDQMVGADGELSNQAS